MTDTLDSRASESHAILQRLADEPEIRAALARYARSIDRREILHRKVVHHPGRLDPVEIDPPLAEQAFRAAPNRDDPSYDRRPESFLP